MDQRDTQRRRRSNVPMYDGNGESIRTTRDNVPVRRPSVVKAAEPGRAGRQPKGRTEELQERMRYGQTGQRSGEERNRGRLQYRDSLYDECDLEDDCDDRPRRPRRRDPHRGLWLMVVILCVSCMAALLALVSPQLLGIQIPGMPTFAFVNGSIITLDEEAYEQYRTCRQYMATDTIYPGVYIDGIHVGGMTRAEAVAAVSRTDADSRGAFSVTVNVGNGSWIIDSSQVPMMRNVEDVVEQAYAYGRMNTTSIRGTRITPFQERLNAANALRSEPVSLTTELTYDRDAVRQLTDAIVTYVNRDAQNASVATFDFNSRTFTFNSDTPGAYIDAEALYTQVTAKIDAGEMNASITVEPEMILAQVTKAELMNSFRQISSYTTETTSNKNRNTNIDLSARAINGTTVLPGETFSFNEATGERTSAKGYLPAAAISGGQSVDEVGGGVCQTSSTLFNAVARANLEIVYRSPHAWPSTYVAKGMDATVNWPNLDFKFRNNTDWPIFIVASYANRKVTVEIYGMSLGDGVTIDLESEVTKTINAPTEVKYVQNTDLPSGTQKQKVKPRKGYEVVTYQVWYQNGKEFNRVQLCTSTYKAYQEVIEYN